MSILLVKKSQATINLLNLMWVINRYSLWVCHRMPWSGLQSI